MWEPDWTSSLANSQVPGLAKWLLSILFHGLISQAITGELRPGASLTAQCINLNSILRMQSEAVTYCL